MKQPVSPAGKQSGHSTEESFLASGKGLLDSFPSAIENSWQRCRDYGLDPDHRSNCESVETSILSEQREKHQPLIDHAQPVMDMLFDQIVDTQSIVVLANNNGLILHSLGNADFLNRVERVSLTPGMDWSEENRGTNAIGTSLATGEAVVVHGDHHYMPAYHFLTCSASPILDPHGKLSGILDVTGDRRSFDQHTLALVRMSVQMIENRMFATKFSHTLTLRFHARPEFVGTLCEGMVAFDETETLLSANRVACFQFGLALDKLRGAKFSSLFGQPMTRIFDHLMVRPQDMLSLTLSNRVRVHARADIQPPQLRRHMRLALNNASRKTPLETFEQKPSAEKSDSCPLSRLQTGDPQIDAVVNKVRKVIGRDIPILITGETGTGKELLASAIHSASPRTSKPFVAVNCAAIPEGLIESELFGYEEGAFTGARRKGNIGRILQADGGTLFLDEIGDMPLSLQARLLRVLQERVVVPLGSLKSYPVDIAVICATHRRIRELVASGQFREDLYFRLNGLTVMLPPLRQRSDLEALVASLLRQLGGEDPPTLAPEVLELFRRHPWPGNLRQLSNLLRTAAVMAEGEPLILREHLPDDFIEDVELHFTNNAAATGLHQTPLIEIPQTAVPQAPIIARAPDSVTSGKLEDMALRAIREAVDHHGGNISAAARALGISRNTLYRKLQQ